MITKTYADQIFFSATSFAATGAQNLAGMQYDTDFHYAHTSHYNELAVAGGNDIEYITKVYKEVLNRAYPLKMMLVECYTGLLRLVMAP